jgi:hypothetical protein
MKEVGVDTQKEILRQLNLRLESLIDLADDYLTRHREAVNGYKAPSLLGDIKIEIKEKIRKPLIKGVLMWAFNFWMERTILPQK